MQSSLILPCALIAAMFLFCQKATDLQKAAKAEASGTIGSALSFYIDACRHATKPYVLPDQNRAEAENKQVWPAKIADYASFALSPAGASDPSVGPSMEGLVRCSGKMENVNYFPPAHVKAMPPDSFRLKVQSELLVNNPALADSVLAANASLVTVLSGVTYLYEGSILERATGKRLDFILYPENKISFIAKPGDYLIIVQSTVTVSQISHWKSPVEVISIQVPDAPSIISYRMTTKIKRNKTE
jgi:hypothetical protein